MYSEDTSESRLSPRTKLAIMVCLSLATMISVEWLARVMHDRRSATLRVEDGVRDALLIRQSPDHSQLLFAGNSLVFDDLSQSALQQALGPGFLVHTAGVPGSTYYDWSYGLHALFARGSQPDVLIFGISPSQFLRDPAATSVPVSLMWRPREILNYQREQRLDLTQLTELLLEHYSTFYSLRNTIRIYIRKFIPGYEAMVYHWTAASTDTLPIKGAAAEGVFTARLARLAIECSSHTQLILVVSPTNQIEDQMLEPALRAAAEGLGVPLIEPVTERKWPLTKFRADQYHLTQPAATEFSKLVATDLRQKLAGSAIRAAGQ